MNRLITEDERRLLLEHGQARAAGRVIDPLPVVRLFTPDAHATWLLVSLDPVDGVYGIAHRGLATPRGAFSKCKQVAAALGTQLERAGVEFRVLRLAQASKGFPDADPRWLKLGKPSWWIHYVVEVDGLELRVLATPGHTPDSLTFWLPADQAVLTGDTVLGYGTTVVHRLGDYLGSLERLRAMADTTRVILPGHGPKLDDPAGALDGYLAHRRERLEQVEAALAAGARTSREVVEHVYADVDRSLWPAAEWSVQAQLDYLAERGRFTAPEDRA